MKLKKILLFSLFILIILSIGVVSASDELISTDLSLGVSDSIIQDSAIDGDIDLVEDDMDENILGNDFPTKESVLNDDSSSGSNTNDVGEETGEVNGENPPQENLDTGDGSNQETGDGIENTPVPKETVISISTDKIKTGYTIYIYLKDKDNVSVPNQELITNLNKTNKNIITNSQGRASLKIDSNPGNYVLNVNFNGNENYTAVSQKFNLTVLKLNSVISPVKNSIIKGNYFYIYLKDQKDNVLSGAKVSFKVNGKTYNATTDKQGKAGFKVNFNIGKYSLKITYNGNAKHKSVTKTLTLFVPTKTKIVIGNTRLLTNGFLRIYLKSDNKALISKKLIYITVNNKKFNKTTNSEGIIIFKPMASTGSLNISAKFDGSLTIAPSSAKKSVKGIQGNAKNPFKYKIPLRDGKPNIDLMTGNFVLGDGSMTYTLTKSQYLNVIRRDSHCLFLNKKLSQYTSFKTKKEPNLYHIIPRKKWNVIERAINTKVVKANKRGYWPKQITVSLKGKSYTYSEVRDEQNVFYSCGPTSSSMCTQVLRNYINEKYLIKLSGARPNYGSSPNGLKKALEKNHFKCTIYQKSSLGKAFKELGKGGCALVFHTWGHYVSIIDISKDGKKVLVSNSRGGYNSNSDKLPTKWLTTKFVKTRFAADTPGLIVKLNYSLSKKTKNGVNNFYSSMGTNWSRKNTAERIPQIGK